MEKADTRLLEEWKANLDLLKFYETLKQQRFAHFLTIQTAFLAIFAGIFVFYLPPLCAGGSDAVGCLNAIADPQAMQVMLSALFAYALHAAQQKSKAT